MAEDLNDDWWEERPVGKSAKRGRDEEEEEEDVEEAAEDVAENEDGEKTHPKEEQQDKQDKSAQKQPLSSKQKKPKAKKKGKTAFKNPVEEQRASLSSPLAAATVFWQAFEKGLDGSLSSVELDDLKVGKRHFVQPPAHVYDGDFMHVGDFLLKACPEVLKDDVKLRKCHPRVLVLCNSAIRGCDLIRGLGPARGGHQIGKFFAKHMKFSQQSKFLTQHVFSIAVGTPGRVTKLALEAGLDFSELALVVLDFSYLDAKNRNLFQVPEVCRDLTTLLRQHLLPLCIAGTTRIALF